ncbi:hypothetical protein BTVI_155860 [Pitangus sulphuratus]|nr:hypothetical protein BTVI_155860 [Pitangus sulphuratus]
MGMKPNSQRQNIDKDIISPEMSPVLTLGNITCDQTPTGFSSVPHHSLVPAIQIDFKPLKGAPVQAMSSQFLQENAVGDSVKGFTTVHVDTSTAFPSSTKGVTFSEKAIKLMKLTVSDHLVVLHMLHDHTQDDLLHDFLQHCAQADSPIAPHIFLLVDGCHIY